MAARRTFAVLATLLAALVAAPAAHSATMTLESVTVDKSALLGPDTDWNVPEGGGTVTWTTHDWTGTYQFPMPTAIAAGTSFTITIKAESRKNTANVDTTFSPRMSVRGDIVEPNDRVDHGADAASATKPTDTQSKTVTLTPWAGRSVVTVSIQDGPVYSYTYQGKADAPPATTPPPVTGCAASFEFARTAQSCKIPRPCIPAQASRRPPARSSAINEVRVVAVQPDVQVHRAGCPEDQWFPAEKDTVLKQGDEISCDPDGAITLQFADNSTVVVHSTTQLKIASFFTEGGVVRTEILLVMGRVAAKVNKSEATKSDFKIKEPTGTSSVRGTEFSVFYDPGSKTSITSVKEGVVEVDPIGAGLPTRMVGAGKEVEKTLKKIGKPVKIGTAGKHKGLTRLAALAKVQKVLHKTGLACGFTTARGANIFSIKPSKTGWTVTVSLVGKVAGKSKWLVDKRKIKASGALAKRIAGGCR